MIGEQDKEETQKICSDLLEKREEFSQQIRREKRELILKKQRQLEVEINKENNIEQPQKGLENINIFGEESGANYGEKRRIEESLQKYKSKKFSMDDLPLLIQMLHSSDICEQHIGTYGVRQLLAVNQPPVQQVIDKGLVPILLSNMRQTFYARLQAEAAWALTNVASGTQAQTQTIIDKGGLDLFINCLMSPHEEVVEQCIWALGNISADSSDKRDLIITQQAIPKMIILHDQLTNQPTKYANWIWTLSNLVRGSPCPLFPFISDTLPYFLFALMTPLSQESLTDCLWAISNLILSLSNFKQITIPQQKIFSNSLLNNKAFSRLQAVLMNNSLLDMQIPVIRLIGSLSSISITNITQLIEKGITKQYLNLLRHKNSHVIREVCISMQQLMKGNEKTSSLLILDKPLIDKILSMAQSSPLELQRDLLGVLCVLCEKSPLPLIQQCLIPYSFVNLLVDQLYLDNSYTGSLLLILTTIQALLRHSIHTTLIYDLLDSLNAFQRLVDLQFHPNQQVYTLSAAILEQFADIDDNEHHIY